MADPFEWIKWREHKCVQSQTKILEQGLYFLQVMEGAASDLNTYYKATEWAMLRFHKEKMREINAIIRELWRQIYRGCDIDYIEIKTDVPEQTCKFYNYCTCAVQSD